MKRNAHQGENMEAQHGTLLLQALQELTSKEQSLTCDTGEAAYREGCMPEGVVLLRKGSLRLETRSSQDTPFVLGVIRGGGIVGLDAVFASRPCQCSAIAVEPSELVLVPKERFVRLLDEIPGARLEVLRLLSSDLCAQHRRIRHLSCCKPTSVSDEGRPRDHAPCPNEDST